MRESVFSELYDEVIREVNHPPTSNLTWMLLCEHIKPTTASRPGIETTHLVEPKLEDGCYRFFCFVLLCIHERSPMTYFHRSLFKVRSEVCYSYGCATKHA